MAGLLVAGVLISSLAIVGLGTLPHASQAQQPAAQRDNEAQKKNGEAAKPATPTRFLKGDYEIRTIAWSPDGKTLASVTYDVDDRFEQRQVKATAVRVWDVQTGEVKRTLAEDEVKKYWWGQVCFSPDGKTLAATSSGSGGETAVSGVVRLWDVETGEVKHTLKHTLLVHFVTFSPDGNMIATATGGNVDRDFETIQLWDAQTGKLQRNLETTNKMAVAVAFAPDGKALAAVLATGEGGAGSTEVTLWDVGKGTLLRALPESDGFPSVTFAPDGKTVLGAARKKLRVWEVETGKSTRSSDIQPNFSEDSFSAFAFAPNGKTVALAGKLKDSYVVTLWDVKGAKLTRTLEGHERIIWSLAFSRDGKTLASASEDHTIRLWDLDEVTKPKK